MGKINLNGIIIGLREIMSGLLSVISKPTFNPKIKALLICDHLRFLGILFLVLFFKSKINKVTIKAFNLKVYFESYTAFFYLFNEIFCRQVYPPYRNLAIYIDAGANIGMTILWYHLFNPSAKIIAFEPETTSYKLLLENIKENKIQNCQIYKIALSDHRGKSKFYLLDDPIQILDSGLTLNQDLPYSLSTVNLACLSTYINETVSLLKIDIEGSEYAVFNDLISTNKLKFIQRGIIETHYFNEEEFKRFQQLVVNLKKFGKISLFKTSYRSTVIEYEKK